MPIQKPAKPDVTLPDNFGGIKTPYSEAQIRDGYLQGVPEIVDGGNINYEKDALFQKVKYCETIADVINGISPNNTIAVDSNNRFTYTTQVQMATDEEFQAGTSELKVPNVKQTKDESSRIISIMNNKVSKSGDTMSGRLVNSHAIGPFTVRTSQYNNNISKDFYGSDLTIDSEDDVNHFFFAGSNFTNNDIRARIVCNKRINGKQIYSEVYAGLKADGTAYSYAPRSAIAESIVTTVYHGNNCVRFGNGIQICFGNSAVNQTITFQQPFKDAGYKVAFCQTDPSAHTYNNIAAEKKTTSFKFTSGYTGDWIAIGYWY